MIDGVDTRILSILQSNARTSNAEIARRLQMAPSAVGERIRKLEERGLVAGFGARLEPRALGFGQLAFVQVKADEAPGALETGRRLAAVPGVLEVHHIAGEDCYLVKVRAADTESLGELLRHRFGAIPSVLSTRTTIVLTTLEESHELPLSQPEDP